ncbi:MAG: glycoside hydrolase family 28 protein [Anaerolineales bacterium]|nr:glycoside hydrolase family 28 protein [Anaerolineales bacterium]
MNQHSVFFSVRDYGATGNGATRDTSAIQAVIDAAAHAGGGTVFVPAGQYVVGSIFLRDHITLHLDAGAVLLGSENPVDYPVIRARWEGVTQDTHASLIAGEGLKNIAVVGRGTIDGRGASWWQKHRAKTLDAPRPRLISFARCSNVLIEGVMLINSPAWTINPVRCENVTVDKVTIINPPDSPNTDGINPDSSRNVHISNCHVDVGDDCVTIKSGIETESPELRVPCENITVTNCTMVHGHGGVVIGSEMSGGVQNVVISNCVFVGTDRGIRIKSRRGRGGFVEDVRVTNVVMRDVLCPFTINLYYHINKRGDKVVSDRTARPLDEGTPRVRHIHLCHVTARGAKIAAGFVYGLPEMPVEDLTLDDVSITLDRDAEPGYADMADDIPQQRTAGFFARNVRGLRLRDVEITNQIGEAFLVSE